jgi:aspartyl-tRNA(Asn)/glutamyl-tRNA(Gln) amidotransferase subunit A
MDFGKTSAGALRQLISEGATTARAAVESSLTAAEKLNESLNAFLEIDRTGALSRADVVDEALRANKGAALAGIPIAIKDNICVRGLQTSCGSRILGDYHPPYDATVIERLLTAGAIMIGKTNCDEFAMGHVSCPWRFLRRISRSGRGRHSTRRFGL